MGGKRPLVGATTASAAVTASAATLLQRGTLVTLSLCCASSATGTPTRRRASPV